MMNSWLLLTAWPVRDCMTPDPTWWHILPFGYEVRNVVLILDAAVPDMCIPECSPEFVFGLSFHEDLRVEFVEIHALDVISIIVGC